MLNSPVTEKSVSAVPGCGVKAPPLSANWGTTESPAALGSNWTEYVGLRITPYTCARAGPAGSSRARAKARAGIPAKKVGKSPRLDCVSRICSILEYVSKYEIHKTSGKPAAPAPGPETPRLWRRVFGGTSGPVRLYSVSQACFGNHPRPGSAPAQVPATGKTNLVGA